MGEVVLGAALAQNAGAQVDHAAGVLSSQGSPSHWSLVATSRSSQRSTATPVFALASSLPFVPVRLI
jgi:hypothetical protein